MSDTYWDLFIKRYKHRLADLSLRQILKVYSAWYVDEVHRADVLIAKMIKANERGN